MNLRPALFTVMTLAAFCISYALYRWGAGGDLDLAALGWEVRRGDDVEAPLEARRRRHEAKRALAAEVVAGRMSLQEAAEHFRRLEEADLGYPPGVPRPFYDEQDLRENVLDYVW